MNMKNKILFALSVFVIGFASAAFAQEPGIVTSSKPGWHKIGDVKASFSTEQESISVIGADKFKSIKLKVTDAPINIQKLQVYYESGEVEDISVDHPEVVSNYRAAHDIAEASRDHRATTEDLRQAMIHYRAPGTCRRA